MSGRSLSVIIPNYNKCNYIIKCVESVMSQTRLPNEVIVVDDCSKDASLAALAKLQERYPILKIVALEKNGGVSNARNAGIEAAQSEYVTFLDSDDYYYDKDKLLREMELIESYYGKEDIIAYSAIVRVDVNDNLVKCNPTRKQWYAQGDIHYDLISRRKNQTTPRDYCVKKSILEEVGGYSYPINFYEDLDLLLRLSKKVKFYYTFGYGTAYRMTPAGLSARSKEKHIEAIHRIISEYYRRLSFMERVMVFLKKNEWRITSRILRIFDRT